MRNRIVVLCGFTCAAAAVSIAIAQTGVCFKYGSLGTEVVSATQNCVSYTVCPKGFRCLNGRSHSKVSDPFTVTRPCTEFINGTGTAPNCTGGTRMLGTTMTVQVPNQTCSGGCLSGPPA